MELLRSWGLESEVGAVAVPAERYRGVIFLTRLAGTELGRIDLRGDLAHDAEVDRWSPCQKTSCPQDMLEPVLKAAAEKLASAQVVFGTEVCDLRQDGERVTATLRDRESGTSREVHARYAIAADGPRGPTREHLNVSMTGPGAMGNQIGIYFKADLWRWIENRPYLLWWIYNPDTTGVFIAQDGRFRWTYNFAYDPTIESAEDFSKERCIELIRAAVGAADLEVEVCSVQSWQMQARLIDRLREGSVFFAGDAAHPLPPTGGQGMNTGLGDIHNLAWKLKLVLDGKAPERFLDSYNEERRPIAKFNVEQSVRNAEKMAASGLAGMLRNDPEVAQAIEGAEGQTVRSRLAAAIPAQREHFEYNGQTLDIRYSGQCVIPDDTAAPAYDVYAYRPHASPGSRAPHMWVEGTQGRISLLDLFGDMHFTLLTTVKRQAYWRAMATDEAAAKRIDIRVFSVGRGGDLTPIDTDFESVYGLSSTGAVLVRPDGHVAWRLGAPPDTASFKKLMDRIFSIE